MWGLLGIAVLGLAGCALPRAALSVRPTHSPPTLAAAAGEGMALSVMQVGDKTFLATWNQRAINLTILKGRRQQRIVLPVRSFCASVGFLLSLPPDVGVAGCKSVWVARGGHWERVPLPTGVVNGDGVSGRGGQWWALAIIDAASGMGSEAVDLWATTTRGASWTLAAKSRNALSSTPRRAIPYGGDKSGLEAGPGHHLWLSGSTGGAFYLYRSTAGLATWTAVSAQGPKHGPHSWVMRSGTVMETFPPLFVDNSLGYVPAPVAGPHDRLAIFVVTGPGWHTATLRGLLPLGTTSSWRLAASRPQTLWVATARSLYRSSTGGRTWQVTRTLPSPWSFVSISFSGSYGSVLAALPQAAHHPGHFALWVTTNGGKTWRAVQVNP